MQLVSEVDPPFPILRIVLAILLSTATALLLMPIFTDLPRLIGFGGPIGLFFSLFLAPIAGLFLGPFMAPLTVMIIIALQSGTVFGLVLLGREQPAAMHPLSWGAAGLIVGALAGTSIGLEISTFGFEIPWTIGSGAVTGLVCGLAARAITTL